MSRPILVLLLLLSVALLSYLDTQNSPPADHYALEILRNNPASGACAPCGAPCQD